MEWSLHVKGYGKIKEADINIRPLTLFVGDNNSGKSYLLSLIWAFKNSEMLNVVYKGIENILDNKECLSLKNQIKDVLTNNGNNDSLTKFQVSIPSISFVSVLNSLLKQNKNILVRRIFNYDKATIEELSISLPKMSFNFCCSLEDDGSQQSIIARYKVKNGKDVSSRKFTVKLSSDISIDNRVDKILIWILKAISCCVFDIKNMPSNFYFPAARTGFILSREVINRYSRLSVFDFGYVNRDNPQFYTKPILHFLDMLEMNGAANKSLLDLSYWIEENMCHGKYQYINESAKSVGFIPNGEKAILPLRTTSAIVTELSPLVILLRHSRYLNSISYEEPEMCLHPELQLTIARCLIKLVSLGVNITATTHSDILTQHISNMCVLNNYDSDIKNRMMEALDFNKDDLIDSKNIIIYQFNDCGKNSSVTEVPFGKNGFFIPTFNDALESILRATLEINGD